MSKMVNDRLRALNIQKEWSAEKVARAVYECLVNLEAELNGGSVEQARKEVFIKAPGQERHFKDESCWVVVYEAGPYEWAISASCCDALPAVAEPYYSFDLCFHPAEWGNLK